MESEKNKRAVFAGGCFWCVEHDLRIVAGVVDAVSGYVGEGDNPTYQNHKGFMEAVEVIYDPAKTSYKKLCQFFLDHIDPTDSGGQFFDRGGSYATAIFYKNEEEKDIANFRQSFTRREILQSRRVSSEICREKS
jgi:methionine-S-sulfoxide reductase